MTGNTGTTLDINSAWVTQPYQSDSGTAESGSNTTLTDNDKFWAADEWQAGEIEITGGTGNGQTRTVAGNTGATISVTTAWATNPDNSSVYTVRRGGDYTVTIGSRIETADTLNLSRKDKYVVVKNTKRWRGGDAAAVTIFDVLREYPDLGFPGDADQNVAADNIGIYPLIWETDGIVDALQDALGVSENNTTPVPGMFVAHPGPAGADAFVPGFVNLLYVNGNNTISVVPESFGPHDGGNDDIFWQCLEAGIPGNEDYVDDWDLYHRNSGEVHCGTNTKRDVPADVSWWDE